MPDKRLTDAYRGLGLEPTSNRLEIEQAYQDLKALYSEEALATYGLCEEEERSALIGEIEAAYSQLDAAGVNIRLSQATCPDSKPVPPLDESTAPADYLRLARENRGMTLRDIADETKIGTRYLAMIEEERYEGLPAPVYLRGFVLDYARTVGVPAPADVARRYLDRLREALQRQG